MPASKQGGKETTLKITRCTAMYHGSNVRGDDYTIYDLDAEYAEGEKSGQKVPYKLRSFTAMTVGVTHEVKIEPYTSERHGRSFTLYPKAAVRRANTEAINDLTERLALMDENMRLLSGRVAGLEEIVGRNVRSGASTPPPADAAALNAQFGEDPPY